MERLGNFKAMHTRFNIKNHLHSFPPERDHRVEASEIEIILDEVFCNLTEVFVSR
jgi:hypothetical protein